MSKELTVGRVSFGPAVKPETIRKTSGILTHLVDPIEQVKSGCSFKPDAAPDEIRDIWHAVTHHLGSPEGQVLIRHLFWLETELGKVRKELADLKDDLENDRMERNLRCEP